MVIIVKIHRYQNNIHIPWDKSVLFADQEGNATDIFIFMNIFIVTFKICCIYAFCLLWLNKAEYQIHKEKALILSVGRVCESSWHILSMAGRCTDIHRRILIKVNENTEPLFPDVNNFWIQVCSFHFRPEMCPISCLFWGVSVHQQAYKEILAFPSNLACSPFGMQWL